MKISQLIEKLQALQATNGDIEVGILTNDYAVTGEITCLEVTDADRCSADSAYNDDESLGENFVQIR